MNRLSFLILFPFAVACVLLVIPGGSLRRVLVRISCAVIAAVSLSLLALHVGKHILYINVPTEAVNKIMLAAELLMTAYIVYMGVRFRQYGVCALSVIQTAAVIIFEFTSAGRAHVENSLFVDNFSVIMALIVGCIGSLIVLYSCGYMRVFHQHYYGQLKDQQGLFFSVLFLFLSAMFGIIFSNNLMWLYFFWEVTTVCSFVLIRYKKTDEANNNAFKALSMNLIGGIAFVAGIIYFYHACGIMELDRLLMFKQQGVVVGAVLLCIAGLAKSAQLPFSSWLVGAMVAPTPVSALLHSTTMVKAGVYLILRFAFILQGTLAGFLIALIGALTFVITSFIAISQNDAKKVLAYSTIANLGLIVLCAGVGTYEAVWAALLLIVFHAVAKCLLFLCVGEVEHKTHSRNIEDMEGLIISMPKLSIMLQIGIAGMFLAPFGMLISKWAVLKALVDTNPLLIIFLVFGSAATVFFWVKWLGKLIIVSHPQREIEQGISASEWAPMAILAFLTVCLCAFFPILSSKLVEPYVIEIYGQTFTMSQGNIQIMSIMLGMVLLFPLSFFNYGKRVKVVDAYLGGVNAADSRTDFYGFANEIKSIELKNYYMSNYWGEAKLLRFGFILCLVLLMITIGAAWL